jgi:hypothetical protein
MAALTAAQNLASRPRAGRHSFVVTSGSTVYAGTFVGTVATGGLQSYDNVATTRFCGIALETVTGNGTLQCRVNTEGVVITTTVAGATDLTSVNAPVYSQTNNPADCTTSAATSPAIGIVIRWISGTTCDVQLYSLTESEAKI